MRVGVICSAGGSACFSALDILFENGLLFRNEVMIITDRACETESGCDTRKLKYMRIEQNDPEVFSTVAYAEFKSFNCDMVFLFFTRLVAMQLHRQMPVFNIHPSLLPAFPGFGALRKARQAGVRFLGATLHRVNGDPDAGPIIGQIMTPVQTEWTEDDFRTISYLQKTYLMLCMVDLSTNNFLDPAVSDQARCWLKQAPTSRSANPCLSTLTLKKAFAELQEDTGFKVVD